MNNRHLITGFVLVGFLLFFTACKKTTYSDNIIDLAGEWSFQMDSTDTGVKEKWYTAHLADKVQLPGSMLTNGKGYDVKPDQDWTGGFWNKAWFEDESYAKYRNPEDVKISFWLQPLKRFAGVAWYQKKIEIPASWEDGCPELILERCHWETSLWLDTTYIGMQNALSTPHIYRLPENLTPGIHTLTLRIDNRIKDIDPGRDAHSVSDNTQTNWNGVIGEMIIQNRPKVYLEQVQVYPNVKKKEISIAVTLNKFPGNAGDYKLDLSVKTKNKEKGISLPVTVKNLQDFNEKQLTVTYSMGDSPLLWDEFNPHLYTLNLQLINNGKIDEKNIDFGMREFAATGRQFAVNGRKVFLRGTLECAIFPKTGFPPTHTDEWTRIFTICKNHGLNHVRFHSWCPPEAAFQAADSVGMYLSVECGAWAYIGSGNPIDRFVIDESERIVATYGNHPSFCMLAYGNEPSGPEHEKFLTGFVSHWKNKDNRRLYTTAAGWPNIPENDFQCSPNPRIQHWEEGLKSIINSKTPNTDYDWTEIVKQYPQPTISHEIGQWCVYPNLKEIDKYDGVLKAKNFEIFRDRLMENNLIHLADSFLIASGKLQTLCYKADIEAAFRTDDFGGFQLLDLHDFPGQGSAIVGVLDPFWDEKGYVTPEEYRRFCNTTVPLARMSKMIFLNDETFQATIELAHFGEKELINVVPQWKLTRSDGAVLKEGQLDKQEKIGFGKIRLGNVQSSLNTIAHAEKLRLSVNVKDYENSWDIWVYPKQLPVIKSENQIKITQSLDNVTEKYLSEGGTVLLTLKKGSLIPEMGGNIAIGFSSIFWNTSWTNGQPPVTLGILCNPQHPMFSYFPTEYHSNYQWWDAMTHSNAIRIDLVSKQIQPIVRVIDDWFTAHPLALIFECKIGKGKLLVSGIDLQDNLQNRTEAKQLMYSIKQYMASPHFNPQTEVSSELIKLLTNK